MRRMFGKYKVTLLHANTTKQLLFSCQQLRYIFDGVHFGLDRKKL